MSYGNSYNGNYPIPLAPPPATAPEPSAVDRRSAMRERADMLREPSRMNISQKLKTISPQEMEGLKKQGFTTGLARAVASNRNYFSLCIWIVDNSGSMGKSDGHRLVETVRTNDVVSVPCTRWEEIQQTVEYHIRMAGVTHAPHIFRLLNDPGAFVGPQLFSVALETDSDVESDVSNAMNVIRQARPGGVTPLTPHILEIKAEVQAMAPQLQRTGRKVTIVIATDGIPTDEFGYEQRDEFVQALRSLEGLPLWIVVRLCTDEEAVVNFYNDLDEHLELSLEVLDDLEGEAEEVYEYNKWLNYALPLHRCREMGFHDRVFDMIDERPLSKSDLRDFVRLVFGGDEFDGMPDPNVDWKEFRNRLAVMVKNEKMQYNPVKKKVMTWIDMKKLDKLYGDSSDCTIS
mmetsp:Transcript_10229/g.15245  ORF Transcript_10229/g.15245 Transcript_10229/m.15245 type:complete len:402 (+) Transcript_10229:50-1255(+)|eukprot:CAMPEP_0196812092 /NCGR_PEP_ID=MMETSP1362-20130617/20228_1 /TAXON_ID=163516 /ORGANISM="Leptocylindrus danicus, Strain CCMP1856" /LENGTH=401 /DNA_ID=CAMNT_0042187511 /DNA_START=50 /DNA_END=1255 /DNA_ORIENTATION=+